MLFNPQLSELNHPLLSMKLSKFILEKGRKNYNVLKLCFNFSTGDFFINSVNVYYIYIHIYTYIYIYMYIYVFHHSVIAHIIQISSFSFWGTGYFKDTFVKFSDLVIREHTDLLWVFREYELFWCRPWYMLPQKN